MVLFFIILAFIFPPVGIPALIIYFFVHKKGNSAKTKEGSIPLSLSKEDAVSQWFFFLAVCFLGVTLLIVNRDIGDPLSWRTIILLIVIAGLVVAYLFRSVGTLIVSLIGLATWWSLQAFVWLLPSLIVPYATVAGLIFIALIYYLAGRFHGAKEKHKRFSSVYLVLGIIGITGYLFLLSSRPGLEMLSYLHKGGSIFLSWQITLSLVVLFLVTIGLVVYLAKKKHLIPAEAGFVVMLLFLFGTALLLPEQEVFVNKTGYFGWFGSAQELSSTGVMWAIIFNVGLFIELLGLIFLGYYRREEWLINLGIFFLFLMILIRYFDWFFSFLDKSLFFIGAGILLFALGWFMEKGRRQLVSHIKTQEKTEVNVNS